MFTSEFKRDQASWQRRRCSAGNPKRPRHGLRIHKPLKRRLSAGQKARRLARLARREDKAAWHRYKALKASARKAGLVLPGDGIILAGSKEDR